MATWHLMARSHTAMLMQCYATQIAHLVSLIHLQKLVIHLGVRDCLQERQLVRNIFQDTQDLLVAALSAAVTAVTKVRILTPRRSRTPGTRYLALRNTP